MPSAQRVAQIKKAEAKLKADYNNQIAIYLLAHRLFKVGQ